MVFSDFRCPHCSLTIIQPTRLDLPRKVFAFAKIRNKSLISPGVQSVELVNLLDDQNVLFVKISVSMSAVRQNHNNLLADL